MSGLIANSKIGDCTCCPARNTECRKRGKDLVCLSCCRSQDVKKQLAKQSVKQKVRSLITYERQEGILDSVQELVIDCDRVVSRYIRLRDMEKDGKIRCYCCGKPVKWEKAHAMHFVNRQHMATRFLMDNLHSGCVECNVEKRGNLEAYAEKLNEEKPGLAEWLQEEGRTVVSLTKSDLKAILFDYQQRLRHVEQKLK